MTRVLHTGNILSDEDILKAVGLILKSMGDMSNCDRQAALKAASGVVEAQVMAAAQMIGVANLARG